MLDRVLLLAFIRPVPLALISFTGFVSLLLYICFSIYTDRTKFSLQIQQHFPYKTPVCGIWIYFSHKLCIEEIKKNATWPWHEPTCKCHTLWAGLNPTWPLTMTHVTLIFGLVTFGPVRLPDIQKGMHMSPPCIRRAGLKMGLAHFFHVHQYLLRIVHIYHHFHLLVTLWTPPPHRL